MRRARTSRMLATVSDQVLHIAIDVSRADDQIQGVVGDGVGQPRPFSGWLGLIGQLDELLAGTAPVTSEERGFWQCGDIPNPPGDAGP